VCGSAHTSILHHCIHCALIMVSEWMNTNTHRCALPGRSSIPLPASLSPCIHQQLFLNQPRLSPATLRGIRQGDISRFLCVCPVLLDLHFHFPCDTFPFYPPFLPAFDSAVSSALRQSFLPHYHCTTRAASASRERSNNTPTVNKRHAALLRLRSATSTSSNITLSISAPDSHSCTRHARA
jgi:hypothetical protein